jgi:non-specific serine/threonine protein kinase/serine/threonine-protein kinase
MNACPDMAVLDELGSGPNTADPSSAGVLAHVESCDQCRATLEEIRRNQHLLTPLRGALRAAELPVTPATPLTGRRIGRFELRGVLGRGGMATVYHAVQDHPHREVALKVMKYDLPPGPARRRFEYEVEVLGRLQHPGIAQIHENGTVDIGFGPQPFFAMELIHGQSLTDYADEKRLDTGQRLKLFAKVCDAVEYAHQKGVIHRDIKPSNILVVDESDAATEPPSRGLQPLTRSVKGQPARSFGTSGAGGQPKILDFGVARATHSDLSATLEPTNVGQLIGTLQFMSPEQAAGNPEEIDTRSDVYALGVVGYLLLSGQLPYNVSGKPIAKAVRLIREEPIVPLGVVNKSLRGDLETIFVKALERDRTRRYPSASALSGDIRRYLNNEPITARPPSATYHLSKFARRHRAAVIGATAVLATLVLGLAGTGLGWRRALNARNLAKTKAAEAARINRLLQEMLTSPSSAMEKGPDYTVRALLDQFSAGLEDQLKEQPEVEAALRETIASTYNSIGVYESADLHLKRALEMRRPAAAADPMALAHCLRLYGRVLVNQGRDREAVPILDQALDVLKRQFQGDRAEIAETLGDLGLAYLRLDDPRAESFARQGVAISRRLLSEEHPDPYLTQSLVRLGYILLQRGNTSEAEPLLREALAISRRVYGEDNKLVLNALFELARAVRELGDSAEAEQLLHQALPLARRIYADEHVNVAKILYHLGQLYRERDNFADAEPFLRKALAIYRKTYGDEHLEVARALRHLSGVMWGLRRLDEAESMLREALEMSRRVGGARHTEVALGLNDLASLLFEERHDYTGAEPLLREAIAILKGYFRTDWHPRLADSERQLAELLCLQGRFAEAESLMARSVVAGRRAAQDKHFSFGLTLVLHGRSLTGLKRFEDAEQNLLKGYDILKAARRAADHQLTSDAVRALVDLYDAWDRPEDAARFRAMLPESEDAQDFED